MKFFGFKILTVLFLMLGFSRWADASPDMTVYEVSNLEWKLWGYRPNVWRMNFDFEKLSGTWAEIQGIDVSVPGSVRGALKKAGIVPDWNMGVKYNASEWVENRHWLYVTEIPDEWVSANNENIVLRCHGLDYKGIVMVNGKEAGQFNNAFIPYDFEIGKFLKETNNTLVFLFECPPENLAQIGWTSKITDWKPRFNYGWDWVPRIVQTGIWDKVQLISRAEDKAFFAEANIMTDARPEENVGKLTVKLAFNKRPQTGSVQFVLRDSNGKVVRKETVNAINRSVVINWENLNIERWYPNGMGSQPLYLFQISLMDESGVFVQKIERRIGFRHIKWLPCEGAVAQADPWICNVNNNSVFLQGINWTPIRPNFADLREEDYRRLLTIYKELGMNVIRVWGGGFPEKEWLYDICDEMGILVWQEFPLSSSGLDNYPPDGAREIINMDKIVRHYVTRLRHHASLLIWCAGNELYERGDVAPITDKHPLIESMKMQVHALDPTRKFVPGSPSGPNIYADLSNYESGQNWDVHGPWKLPFRDDKQNMTDVYNFWAKDDALFHSEVGVPGAMSAEMIRKYAGKFNPLPANHSNPIWRTVNWWIDWEQYLSLHNGQAPSILEEYVDWSTQRQAQGLAIALEACKKRFPRCGGFIIWMGHDCYPCPVNTSIIDFEGNPKPAAQEISKIWKKNY